MAPSVGKAAFTVGLTILFMAVFVLFSLKPGSPEFVVDVVAIVVDGVFIGLVIWSVRRAARLPKRHSPSDHEDERFP